MEKKLLKRLINVILLIYLQNRLSNPTKVDFLLRLISMFFKMIPNLMTHILYKIIFYTNNNNIRAIKSAKQMTRLIVSNFESPLLHNKDDFMHHNIEK